MFVPLFTASMSGVALYVYIRLILPLPLPIWARILLGIAVVVIANRVVLVRTFEIAVSDRMLLLGSWLHAGVLLMGLLSLFTDIVLLIFRPELPDTWRALGLAGLGLLISAYGIRQALRAPPVREVAMAVEGLAPALENLRIAVLSDIHIGPLFRRRWVNKVVDRTLAAKPDLIAMPGDIVDSPEALLARDVEPLSRLDAPHGVFVSPGNHEYIYGVEGWLNAYARMGMRVLYNAHATIRVRGEIVTVAGVADPVGAIRPGKTPDLKAALAGAPKQDAFRLLLAHRPNDAAAAAAMGVNLQVSGHTHGGQVWLFRRLTAAANGGYAGGWYDVGKMRLLVSNGVGLWAGMPLRLGVGNQIWIVRLTAG
jgi:uncharacterized protein